MIPISFEVAFFLYVLIWFVFISILWVRELWRTSMNDWQLSEGNLAFCRECSYLFLVNPGEKVVKCPRCGSSCYLKRRIKWKRKI